MFEQPAYAETGSRIQFIQIKRANLEILLMNDRNAHTKIFEDHSRKLPTFEWKCSSVNIDFMVLMDIASMVVFPSWTRILVERFGNYNLIFRLTYWGKKYSSYWLVYDIILRLKYFN